MTDRDAINITQKMLDNCLSTYYCRGNAKTTALTAAIEALARVLRLARERAEQKEGDKT